MLSMSFLTMQRGGLEFIDFQSDDFHRKLSSHLAEMINGQLVLSKDAYQGIKDIIKEYIGFRNIKIELVEDGNLSVNVGYFSPKHVLNSKGLDEFLKPAETTLYKWFVKNKEKVFEGGVDFRTGRVTGSFQDLPITMKINVNLKLTFPSDKIEKYEVPMHEVLSGAITHEMGHCYGGCALMATMAADNVIARAALNHYRGGQSREERITVLKDTAQLLELPAPKQQELQEIAQDESDAAMLLFFNKLVAQRNTSRALSLGVEEMSSEVIADVYAIRMGCGKAVVAAIGALVDHGCIMTVMNAMMFGIVYTLISAMLFAGSLLTMALAGIPLSVLAAGGLLIFLFASVIGYFMPGFHGVYNSNHRRFEDAVRQLIAKLKEVEMPAADKAELLKDIEKLLEINKTIKPWYEGTALKRMLGWLLKGSDFKKSEHEHFTQALVNNEMTVFAERLKTLA
ncbi:hypothetical protein D3C79_47610 [compost metagenome]